MLLISTSTLTVLKESTAQHEVAWAQVEWKGRPIEIASMYTPVRPLARVDFFKDHLKDAITNLTYSGGDWNCVPDTTLDVISPNPLNYPNTGARLLETKMTELGCADAHRDQLGNEKVTTRTGTNRNGDKISTRH